MALLTTRETGYALGVQPIYVGRLLKEGILKGVQLENEWLVDSRSILRYQEKQGKEFTHCPVLKLGCPVNKNNNGGYEQCEAQ